MVGKPSISDGVKTGTSLTAPEWDEGIAETILQMEGTNMVTYAPDEIPQKLIFRFTISRSGLRCPFHEKRLILRQKMSLKKLQDLKSWG